MNLLLVGQVDSPVREAVLSGISPEVAVRESTATGGHLLEEAIRRGAVALVTTRADAEDLLDRIPETLLVIGVSASRQDVLVARDGDAQRLANPTVDDLDDLVRGASAYADGISDG